MPLAIDPAFVDFKCVEAIPQLAVALVDDNVEDEADGLKTWE